ncbi:MAG TPA: hypothetical protein VN875_04365 [Candidatus Binatus sp.]|jgi:hypothetical protein|nr:hypothetical protein [Candidatus Binatus sp.]
MAGKMLGALSIKPFEGGRWRSRWMRGNGWSRSNGYGNPNTMCLQITHGENHGSGANRVEPTRTGPIESVARDTAEATDAAGSRRATESKRPARMLLRLRERGDRSLVHGLRGRPSNRKLATRLEQKVLARLRQRYADFGSTLAAEHLAQEGFSVSRETLGKWMTQAALWRPRSQRLKTIHVWRERRACFGELVMQDS